MRFNLFKRHHGLDGIKGNLPLPMAKAPEPQSDLQKLLMHLLAAQLFLPALNTDAMQRGIFSIQLQAIIKAAESALNNKDVSTDNSEPKA